MICCVICNLDKQEDQFYKFKGKINGKKCKECRRKEAKQKYILKKKEKKICTKHKRCSICCTDKEVSKYDKNSSTKDGYSGVCKNCINQKRRLRYSKLSKEEKRNLYHKNADYYKSYRTMRRRRDIEFKLRCYISTSIYNSLKNDKGCSFEKFLPYSILELKEHIEGLFTEGMTWDNYGEWHIDHIYPQSLLPFSSLEDHNFQKCWKLSNLQPLWAYENLQKSNKILK
jgi:hypothetical protein